MGTKYSKNYFIRQLQSTKEKDFPVRVEQMPFFISPRKGAESSAWAHFCWILDPDLVYLSEEEILQEMKTFFSKRRRDGYTPKQRFTLLLQQED